MVVVHADDVDVLTAPERRRPNAASVHAAADVHVIRVAFADRLADDPIVAIRHVFEKRVLSAEEARELVASGVASGGMVPKVEASLRALSCVPLARIIDGRSPHALLKEVEGHGEGTSIE